MNNEVAQILQSGLPQTQKALLFQSFLQGIVFDQPIAEKIFAGSSPHTNIFYIYNDC